MHTQKPEKYMKSGYNIKWTDNALEELKITFEYLEDNWTEKEISKLSAEIEKTIQLISNNPMVFAKSDFKEIRRAVVLKLNSIYYLEKDNNRIEIISFFANRKDPKSRRI